jgi:hypothetical protein
LITPKPASALHHHYCKAAFIHGHETPNFALVDGHGKSDGAHIGMHGRHNLA